MRPLLLLVLLVACAEPPARAPATAVEAPARVQLPAWRGHRALPMMPEGSKRAPSYVAAAARWRTATTAYAQGDAAAAAESFLESAAALAGDHPEPLASAFAAGRCLAYENAARAYTAAQRFDEAETELAAAARLDPSCRSSIAGALDRLQNDRPAAAISPMWRAPR